MSTAIRPAYGQLETVTITLASLGNGSARESLTIDFTALTGGAFADLLVMAKVKTVGGTVGSDQAVYVYGYGDLGNAVYPDTVTGADAAITLTAPTQLGTIGRIHVPDDGISYIAGPFSFRSAFGGTLPPHGGIVVLNRTGLAFSATAGDLSVTFKGVYDLSA